MRIVKADTCVTGIEEFSEHGNVSLRYFGPAMPTSTAVEIRRLAHPDLMIEVDVLVIVDD